MSIGGYVVEIQTNKILAISNVVAFRKEMEEHDIQRELQTFSMYLQAKGVKKVGPTISTTYELKEVDNKNILDIEFLLPINKEIDVVEDYRFIKEFRLTNALYISYTDSLSSIENTYTKMFQYLKDNGLEAVTSFYNVQVNENEVNQGASPIVDIYIGINPNTL